MFDIGRSCATTTGSDQAAARTVGGGSAKEIEYTIEIAGSSAKVASERVTLAN